jgi:hypothetical protein
MARLCQKNKNPPKRFFLYATREIKPYDGSTTTQNRVEPNQITMLRQEVGQDLDCRNGHHHDDPYRQNLYHHVRGKGRPG